ncbi:MAG: hypothetical protein WCV88_05215 [Patescibacteria group bacterium]|jgi:hypothetical protein
MKDLDNPARQSELSNLADPAVLAKHLAYLQGNVSEERASEALVSIQYCNKWLKEHLEFALQFPEQYKKLVSLLTDNQWIALRMLSPAEQAVELFQKHLLALFSLPQRYEFAYENDRLPERILTEDIRNLIFTLGIYSDRDAFKVKLITALTQNQEIITSASFFEDIKQIPATTANWLKAYVKFMGREVSVFQETKFLRQSENGAKLSSDERHRLELIFKLIRRLSLSSYDPYGNEDEIFYEDDNGEMGVFIYGEKHPYDPVMVKDIKALYPDLETEQGVPARPPVYNVEAAKAGPDIAATAGPDYFTDKDQAEINKLGQTGGKKSTEVDYHQMAQEIREKVAVVFKSPEDEKKFMDVVVSVLRGLRDTMELKTYLQDLAIPTAECEAVIAAVKQALPSKTASAVNQPAKRLATKPNVNQLTKVATPVVSPNPQFVASVEPVAERPVVLPKLRRTRAQKRPMVDDVRLQPTMMMGPIDELRAFDTLEFRRLAPDPVLAARRIHDKIELLAEESITKQAEGIDAFKQSPINKLYLELGNESITSGQAVTAVIAARTAKGIPTLSEVEFDAISDLNRQLRF